jgi:catechol 2,3-dioxygenase-like lactoylglutathione lyase family enzyme
MDNVGIVVADLDAAIEFFVELGLELEGRAPIEGETVTAGSSSRASHSHRPRSTQIPERLFGDSPVTRWSRPSPS